MVILSLICSALELSYEQLIGFTLGWILELHLFNESARRGI
jgi:hypothetical protein